MRHFASLFAVGTVLLAGCDQPLEPVRGDAAGTPPVSAATSPADIAFLVCLYLWDDADGFDCTLSINGVGGIVSWPGADEYAHNAPSWSPDGQAIAVAGEGDILAVRLADRSIVNLTRHPAEDRSPAWSPDGARIVFASDREGSFELYLMHADGANVVRLTSNVGLYGERPDPDWSPDGTRIAFNCVTGDNRHAICAIDADGTDFSRIASGMSNPAWSPDGSRIAANVADGDALATAGAYGEMVLLHPDGSSITSLLHRNFGGGVDWSPDGSRLVAAYPQAACNADNVCQDVIFIVDADGSNNTAIAAGFAPAWGTLAATPPPNAPPVARFTTYCNHLTCVFDGTASSDEQQIVQWVWRAGAGDAWSGESTATHTFATAGTYDVSLTVFDAAGASGSAVGSVTVSSPVPPADAITLIVVGSTKGANSFADLRWSGSSAANVDVYRNGARIVTTANDGEHRDTLGKRVTGTFTYVVCNAATATCSPSATVRF